MHNQFSTIFLLLTALFIASANCKSRKLAQYTISSVRSPQLNQFCSQVNRSSLNQKYNQPQQVLYSNDFTRLFTVDNKLFDQFLEFDVLAMNSTLKENTGGYLLFVVLPLVGLALLVVSAFVGYILLFCPFDCCLRKKLDYTSCQQFWPMVLVSVFGVAAISCCITVLVSDFKFYQGYQELSCGSIVVFDDLINGNFKSDNSTFFAGVKMIASQLSFFDGKSNAVYNSLSKISSKSSQINNILNLVNNGKFKVSQVPNNDASSLVLKYKIPFRQSIPNATISSTFEDILGNYSSNTSLIGAAYKSLDVTYSVVNTMRDVVDSFLKTQLNYSNNSNSIKNIMNNTSQYLDASLLTLSDMINRYSIPPLARYIQVLVYGVTIVLVSLLLISLLFFISYSKMWCRHFIYIFSFFLLCIAVGLFLASILLGFAVPIAYTGISYFSDSLKNTTSFVQLLQKFGNPPSVGKAFSVCLPNGNGDIIAASGSTGGANYLSLLKNTMTNITTLDSQNLSTQINSSYLNLQKQLKSFSNNNILDISDTSAIGELKNISNPKNYACSAGNFEQDSWIPSIAQKDNSIPCQSSASNAFSDNSTCKSTSDFELASPGCKGCMSTFSLLYQFNQSSSVQSYLGKRYADCQRFISQLSNTWNNFYLIKRNTLQPVIQREAIASPVVNQVQQNLSTTIGPLIQSTLNQLYLSAGSVLNPKTGLLGGLNCKVIADDINVFTSSLYRNTFSYSFHHKIYLTAISFCLLFLLCCNTFVLFRKKRDILNAINFPTQHLRVRAQPIPLSGDRIININL